MPRLPAPLRWTRRPRPARRPRPTGLPHPARRPRPTRLGRTARPRRAGPPRWTGPPWLRLPRRTVRLRLTVLYGGLFLVSGAALLAITYFLLTRTVFGSQPLITESRFVLDGLDRPPVGGSTVVLGGHAGGPSPLRQILALSSITLAAMLVVSIALGWLMAGRVLRPLRTMTASARQISEDSLHRRLAVTGPDDELKDLADTIDGLLGRLDAAFDAQREALDAQQRFVANASHELRGPLTLERAVLEIALADPGASVPSLRATCERVLAASRQQERLIDALLTLARGQRGLDRAEPFDLAAITDEVLLARQAGLTDRRLRLTARLATAPALGDPRLAERLVINLVDNAIRHNVPGGHVAVAVSTRDGRAVLSVANTGPAIPPGEVDRLLRPFQRLGADRTGQRDGHGLGLSIVAAVAAAHGAELRVGARPGGGLEVTVLFPPGRPPAPGTGAPGATAATPPAPPAAANPPAAPDPPAPVRPDNVHIGLVPARRG